VSGGARKEQSHGTREWGAALKRVVQVTKRKPALVEEAAAAAESMKQQASRLAEVVGVFQIAA